jgi:hypothetical protein
MKFERKKYRSKKNERKKKFIEWNKRMEWNWNISLEFKQKNLEWIEIHNELRFLLFCLNDTRHICHPECNEIENLKII